MKLPKRIAEVIKQKDAFLLKQEQALNKALTKTQTDLLNRLASEVISKIETKDGRILDTKKNYQLLTGLDNLFKKFEATSQKNIAPTISETTRSILDFNKKYFKVSLGAGLPTTFSEVASKTADLMNTRLGIKGGEIVAGSFLATLIKNDSALLEVKNFIAAAVTQGMPTKEFIKQLTAMVMGDDKRDGFYEAQFKRFAHDIYMQYDSATATSMATALRMDYFIYQGGIIEDSRDFCVAHDAKVWSREDSETWPKWTPQESIEKGEFPLGYEIKQKDRNKIPSYLSYEGYVPLIDRGGYNCRHYIGWIADELAQEMLPK